MGKRRELPGRAPGQALLPEQVRGGGHEGAVPHRERAAATAEEHGKTRSRSPIPRMGEAQQESQPSQNGEARGEAPVQYGPIRRSASPHLSDRA